MSVYLLSLSLTRALSNYAPNNVWVFTYHWQQCDYSYICQSICCLSLFLSRACAYTHTIVHYTLCTYHSVSVYYQQQRHGHKTPVRARTYMHTRARYAANAGHLAGRGGGRLFLLVFLPRMHRTEGIVKRQIIYKYLLPTLRGAGLSPKVTLPNCTSLVCYSKLSKQIYLYFSAFQSSAKYLNYVHNNIGCMKTNF